jgi:zinc protease
VSPVAARGLAPVREVFSNGVVLITQHTVTHPAVTVYATLEAGSGHDLDGKLGLANFVARVIDRGTVSRDTSIIAATLDDRGVSLSTGVTRHLLSLSCTCLAEDLDAIVELLADVIRQPAFPADQVDRRRGTIITGLRQDEDNPSVVAADELMALLYGRQHPYGRPGRGTVASVDGIGRDDLVAFHRTHIGPAGLRLVVVGDVEAPQVSGAVARAFGDWTHDMAAPLRPSPVTMAPERRAERKVVPGKPQSDIAYGYTTIARHDPRYYALVIMNNALGQYALGGRLGDNIRERQGMAYYVFSSFDANVVEGPLVVRAGVSPANVERTIAAIDEELSKMAREGLTEAELADSRRYLVGSMPRVLETNIGIATFLHNAEFYGLGLDFDQRIPDLLGAVLLDDVNEVARTFLDPARATIVVAGP